MSTTLNSFLEMSHCSSATPARPWNISSDVPEAAYLRSFMSTTLVCVLEMSHCTSDTAMDWCVYEDLDFSGANIGLGRGGGALEGSLDAASFESNFGPDVDKVCVFRENVGNWEERDEVIKNATTQASLHDTTIVRHSLLAIVVIQPRAHLRDASNRTGPKPNPNSITSLDHLEQIRTRLLAEHSVD